MAIFFLNDGEAKIVVEGTSGWALLRISPQSLQKLKIRLANSSRIEVKGLFSITGQIKKEFRVIAEHINSIEREAIWHTPIPLREVDKNEKVF